MEINGISIKSIGFRARLRRPERIWMIFGSKIMNGRLAGAPGRSPALPNLEKIPPALAAELAKLGLQQEFARICGRPKIGQNPLQMTFPANKLDGCRFLERFQRSKNHLAIVSFLVRMAFSSQKHAQRADCRLLSRSMGLPPRPALGRPAIGK